jgi:hypothetical protein
MVKVRKKIKGFLADRSRKPDYLEGILFSQKSFLQARLIPSETNVSHSFAIFFVVNVFKPGLFGYPWTIYQYSL